MKRSVLILGLLIVLIGACNFIKKQEHFNLSKYSPKSKYIELPEYNSTDYKNAMVLVNDTDFAFLQRDTSLPFNRVYLMGNELFILDKWKKFKNNCIGVPVTYMDMASGPKTDMMVLDNKGEIVLTFPLSYGINDTSQRMNNSYGRFTNDSVYELTAIELVYKKVDSASIVYQYVYVDTILSTYTLRSNLRVMRSVVKKTSDFLSKSETMEGKTFTVSRSSGDTGLGHLGYVQMDTFIDFSGAFDQQKSENNFKVKPSSQSHIDSIFKKKK